MVGGVWADLVGVPLQTDIEGTIFVGVLFLVGLVLVYDGFSTWQRMRLMQDTPTEKVRSAAVGRTELNGTGKPIDAPLRRPFDDGTCLVATWEIEEWEEDHDDDSPGRDGHWSTVDSGMSCRRSISRGFWLDPHNSTDTKSGRRRVGFFK